MADKYFPKITAKNIAEFEKIETAIKTLPTQIIEQIEMAENWSVGINCNLKKSYDDNNRIILPDYTTQISNFGDYMGCYSDKFFFKIPTNEKDKHFSYLFIKTTQQ